MKVEYSITGSVDIPPALLALMEASGKSPNEYVRELFLTADTLPAFLSDAQITVDGSESDAKPLGREFGDKGVAVASAPRTVRHTAPQPRPAGGTGNTVKPMGRPATLWDHKCSDGGAVRERGDRSIESLVAAGHEVYRLDENGEVAETFGSKPVKPTAKKSASPVSKGFRPPVTNKRRGQ